MKILILTQNGIALGLAHRLAIEGHDIDIFSGNNIQAGGDLYTISTNVLKSIQECKFIVADSCPEIVYKKAKTYNKPIIGCNEVADQLNADAVKEYDLCSRLGVSYPNSELYDDAVGLHPKLLEGDAKRYYIKHKRRVFVCTKPEWLAWAMYQLPADQRVLLQEEVVGHDVAVVGWFNGLNWVKPFFYSSPYSDRVGGVVMLSQKKESRLTEKTIAPLDQWLKIIDYRGPVTVNLIVNKTHTFVKNFHIGLTAPCVFAMIESLKEMPLADFLNLLAFGTGKEVSTSLDYLVGIRVSSSDSDMHGAPILGVENGNLSHLFFQGAYRDNGNYLVSSEIDPVYTAVAHGRDLEEAARRVYRTVSEVQFPGMSYITNLHGQMSTTFNKLKGWSII